MFIPTILPVCCARESPTSEPTIASAAAPFPSPPNTFTFMPLQSNGGPV